MSGQRFVAIFKPNFLFFSSITLLLIIIVVSPFFSEMFTFSICEDKSEVRKIFISEICRKQLFYFVTKNVKLKNFTIPFHFVIVFL